MSRAAARTRDRRGDHLTRCDARTDLDKALAHLDRPRYRVLRAARWFDWFEPAEIGESAGYGEVERDALYAILRKLAAAGLLEHRGNVYRLTLAGRKRLAEATEKARAA